MKHITVLKTEAVDALQLSADSCVLDVTFGSGGHAQEIIKHLGATGTYIGFDADLNAIETGKELLTKSVATVHLVNTNFRNLDGTLSELGINKVDAILADLGWRMDQFTDGGKGFSFHDESPLLMTYGDPNEYEFTAYDIVNDWDEENIADIIYGYGEERRSRRIAKAIVTARVDGPITTGKQLSEIVAAAIAGNRYSHIHPATKTFQALRIAVNDELGVLERLLRSGMERLRSGGRMAIITFHSLEDRMVKRTFLEFSRDQRGVRITKKPITPSIEEITSNPRARSAKLRIIEKI